jgi:hypothetical protein
MRYSPLKYVQSSRAAGDITKARDTESQSNTSLFDTHHQTTTQIDHRYLPLNRIFLRLNEADVLSQRRSATILVHQALTETCRRVKAEHQRIEDLIFRARGGAGFVYKETKRSEPQVNRRNWADDLSVEFERAKLAPPIDVNSLTDQVIKQIDQRATAWRERMGRI